MNELTERVFCHKCDSLQIIERQHKFNLKTLFKCKSCKKIVYFKEGRNDDVVRVNQNNLMFFEELCKTDLSYYIPQNHCQRAWNLILESYEKLLLERLKR